MLQHRISIVSVIAFVFCSCGSHAQQSDKDLIPRSVLFDLEDRKEMIKISHDGNYVFYVMNPYQPIPDHHIYCLKVEGDEKNEMIFEGGVAEYEVINEKQLIVRTMSSKGQSVVLKNFVTGEEDPLFQKPFRNIKWLAFDQNKTQMAFVAMLLDGAPGLFTVNLDTKQVDTLKNIAEGHYPLFFDDNLNVVAGEKIDRSTGEKYLDYYDGNEWKTLAKYEWSAERFLRPGLKSILGVNNDGTQIYYTDNSQTDKTVLRVFDTQLGEKINLLEEQNSDLMPNSFLVDAKGIPVAIANHYAARQWSVLNDKFESDFTYLSKQFKDFQVLHYSEDFNYWLIEEMNGGANVSYVYNRPKQTLKQVFTDHEALTKFAKVNRFYDEVSSFDKTKLPIQIYLSEKYDQDKDGQPDQEMPAVIYVHGGPWQGWMEDFWMITRHLQLLADRGYLVVYSQFRGALTYGKEFLDKGNKQWGEDMMKDKVAIAKWVKERNVKEDKIGIFGWSYGGYAALAGAAFSPETYACAVGLYGPTYLDATEEENVFGYSPNSLLRIADVTTEEGMDLAHRHSPLYFADDVQIPILMSTGAKDERVPQLQMDKMAEALYDNGKDVTYLVYPGEGHDYASKATWLNFWGRAEQFLSKNLGGAYEEIHDEEKMENMIIKYDEK